MTRKSRYKPKPRPDTAIVLTKEGVAKAQLETAIKLWFERGDPISMLVLAYNAHAIVHAFGKQKAVGRPSEMQTWLETMPDSFQERWKYVNNFCKHGFLDLNEDTAHDPRQAEILMYFACRTYRGVFRSSTPLMLAFAVRLLIENPDFAVAESQEVLAKIGQIELPEHVTRQQFLDEWFDLFYTFAGATDFGIGLFEGGGSFHLP